MSQPTRDAAGLAEIYARLTALTDPLMYAVSQATEWGRAAEALKAEALTSGAMLGEFRVMHQYRRTDRGSKMATFLA